MTLPKLALLVMLSLAAATASEDEGVKATVPPVDGDEDVPVLLGRQDVWKLFDREDSDTRYTAFVYTFGLRFCPRPTLLYLQYMHPEVLSTYFSIIQPVLPDVVHESAFWPAWFLSPSLLVALLGAIISNTNPVAAVVVVSFSCVASIAEWRLWYLFLNGSLEARNKAVYSLFIMPVTVVGAVVAFALLYPVIPWQLCNAALYGGFVMTALNSAYTMLISLVSLVKRKPKAE